MSEHTLNRVAFRMTESDERHLMTIARGIRERGRTFATKTDAIRAALEFTAGHVAELPADSSRR